LIRARHVILNGAKRRVVETSGREYGVSLIRDQVFPLRPSASGGNDKRCELTGIRPCMPSTPLAK